MRGTRDKKPEKSSKSSSKLKTRREDELMFLSARDGSNLIRTPSQKLFPQVKLGTTRYDGTMLLLSARDNSYSSPKVSYKPAVSAKTSSSKVDSTYLVLCARDKASGHTLQFRRPQPVSRAQKVASSKNNLPTSTPSSRQGGSCPQGLAWIRAGEDNGYWCGGGAHFISDALLAEGKGGVVWKMCGLYYPDRKDSRRYLYSGPELGGKHPDNAPTIFYTDGTFEVADGDPCRPFLFVIERECGSRERLMSWLTSAMRKWRGTDSPDELKLYCLNGGG